MNILTFDIEEWYVDKAVFNRTDRYSEYDRYLDDILGILDERGFRGTFFCVGGMARDFPGIVRKIESYGHEIGCHSFNHVWLNKMTEQEVFEDTRISVDALEQCIGKKVKSYRAPAFSIGKENKFVFEILSRCGIERDASVFPAERDFGGFPEFGNKTPTITIVNNIRIKEFPICTARIFRKELAYSGGGYFRFFPLSFIRREMARSDYNMTYFHIGELVPEPVGLIKKDEFENYFKIPGTLKNRALRYIKTNIGKKGVFVKLQKLIDTEEFVNLEQADNMIAWDQSPSVVL